MHYYIMTYVISFAGMISSIEYLSKQMVITTLCQHKVAVMSYTIIIQSPIWASRANNPV